MLICIDSKCCHSFPFHNAVSPVLTVLEIFVLTVAWNVFSHISWHYAINCLKMQGGVFPPAVLLKYVRLHCAFRSPFHPLDTEVQSWRSILLKWRGLCSCNCSFHSSSESARDSGTGFCSIPGADMGALVTLTANCFALGPVAETLLARCTSSSWCQQGSAHG